MNQSPTVASRWPIDVVLAMAAMALMFGVFIYGAVDTKLFAASPWSPSSLRTLCGYAVLLAGVLWVAKRKSWCAPLLLVAVLGLVAASVHGTGALLSAFIVPLSCFALGAHFVRPEREAGLVGRVWASIVSVGTGLAIYVTIIAITAPLRVHYTFIYLIALLLPFLWCREASVARLRQLVSDSVTIGRDANANPLLLFAVLLPLTLQFLLALQPETGHDALAVHLTIPYTMFDQHAWPFDVTNRVWAAMPMSGDWAFTLAFSLGGEEGARLFNWSVGCLLAIAVYGFLRLRVPNAVALAGAALSCSSPIAMLESASLFVENVWTLFVFLALAECWHAGTHALWRRLLAASLVLGAALSAKLMTAFIVPLFLVVAIALLLKHKHYSPGTWVVATMLFLVSAVPPYLAAVVLTGNPVFPFFNQIFQSPLYSISAFDNAIFHHNTGWRLLYDMTFHSERYIEGKPGAAGVAWLLLALPAALLLRRAGAPAGYFVIAIVLLFGGTFSQQTYLRYVAPVLPLFAVVAALAIHGVATILPQFVRGALAIVLSAVALNIWFSPTSGWQTNILRQPPLLGGDQYSQHEVSFRPERAMVEYLNLQHYSRVVWFGHSFAAGATPQIILTNWYNYGESKAFALLENPEEYLAWLQRLEVSTLAFAQDGRNCKKPGFCEFIEKYTQPVYARDGVEVRIVREEFHKVVELLSNGGFDAGIDGWGGAIVAPIVHPGAVNVSVDAPLVQDVAAEAGERYRYALRVRCAGPQTDYRMQVNWLDKSRRFIEPSIAVGSCASEWKTDSVEFTAPRDTAFATVYANSHTTSAVEIDYVSFSRKP